ncbi:uncharacterized protein LOC109842372 [Asparagus officinalis]|uniref:uncharacterized protein LOC109842372 n=1 Tax=Asparagus officinalis TaxID=4686 RepID=UPI00098DEFB0|nr:uncharacterized protein LOC109842372 [Asparagus officinalis]
MLFLLVVDVLCRMLHNSCDHGDLAELHLKGSLNDIKSLQFTGDTIVFCKADPSDISNLKSILYLFECTSGLSINFSKSNLFYSGKSSTKGPYLANILNCSFASPPFKYLGLPLKRGSLSKADWQPLIDSLHRKLSIWRSKQLSIGGRLVLLKSVLSSIPLYYMSFFNDSKAKAVSELGPNILSVPWEQNLQIPKNQKPEQSNAPTPAGLVDHCCLSLTQQYPEGPRCE